jgi:hypothetical protein
MQLGWLPSKQNLLRVPHNQLIIPLGKGSHNPNRMEETGAESDSLLRNAYAEIHYLRTMVERGRPSDTPNEELSGNTVKKRSRRKARKVTSL